MHVQVFHTDSLAYYAEQKAAGREFPKFMGDDVHQVCTLRYVRKLFIVA